MSADGVLHGLTSMPLSMKEVDNAAMIPVPRVLHIGPDHLPHGIGAPTKALQGHLVMRPTVPVGETGVVATLLSEGTHLLRAV